MSAELATKLRLLAQDIDDAQAVIGHIENRRGGVARQHAASVAVPQAPAPLALPAPVDVPSWARPGAPPLTHWQRWGLTYLFAGVVAFVLGALVVITQGVLGLFTGLMAVLAPYLAFILGLPAVIALIAALAVLCRGGGRHFTFQGTGRLF